MVAFVLLEIIIRKLGSMHIGAAIVIYRA